MKDTRALSIVRMQMSIIKPEIIKPEIMMTRRRFVQGSLLLGAGITLNSLNSCAVNPVTGENQLMMVSQDQEISMDKSQSPYQFSTDYGAVQDQSLNAYVTDVGKKLAVLTHRPQMPYSFRCVNATYINAYAFPGGSIAVTRGILLKLSNEAELAALLGHELGHVNARHSAQQISKSTVSSIFVSGIAAAIGTQGQGLGDIAAKIGMLGQGVLLARYSRDNEREADALGNAYMVKAGYSSKGFVGLMSILNNLNKTKPSSTDLLFSTHPMSDERYDTAVAKSRNPYGYSSGFPLNKERYMDKTASLRAMKDAIEALQEGELYMAKKEYQTAETKYVKAIKLAKEDYAAHVMMAKCMLETRRFEQAASYADLAVSLYPQEAQAHYVAGFAHVNTKQFARAFERFDRYDKLLPGNPGTLFFKGYCQEGLGSVENAAGFYKKYITEVQQGEYAAHAYERLKKWGYI